MKRRDFFTKLVKTVGVVAITPSVLRDSELKAEDYHDVEPENDNVKWIESTQSSDYTLIQSSGWCGITAPGMYELEIDKAAFAK